jgi:hypothetical protein
MQQRLQSYGTIDTPPQAVEAAARKPAFWTVETLGSLAWSDARQRLVSGEFRRLKAVWRPVADGPDLDIWDNARAVIQCGRCYLEGDCASFVPELARRLMAAGLDRAALRPVLCHVDGQAHMVLDLETDRGSLIACNLTGVNRLGSRALRRHRWAARQGAGGVWERLYPKTLEDLVAKGEAHGPQGGQRNV